MFNFFRSKKRIKFSCLYKSVEKLANGRHFRVAVHQAPHWYTQQLGYGTGIYLEAYIAGLGIVTARTIPELLDAFNNQAKTSKIEEVEF